MKLQEIIRNARKEGKRAYGFVVWIQGDAVKEKLTKLAEEKKIEDIAICYLPNRQRENYLKLLKIEPSDKLRNIIVVYRDKRVAARFVNLDAKDFKKVEEAFKEILK
ncbi:MAG: hypothetical protein NZ805_08795 [Armatimonadetes bacterium]|nr:hypothetical protein [Armatimonadota bacterium]MDW8028204.1 hypothetical protein [Armatimonadota bacterium]